MNDALHLRIQLRVLGALLMREVITRYGRHNVGFLWLLLEPILFCGGVVVLWTVTQRGSHLPVEVAPFVVLGYSTLLLWRNCAGRSMKAVESNRSLMHHHQVKIQDILLVRVGLEICGVTAAFITLFLTLGVAGLLQWPADPALLIGGWLVMAWFSAALGFILGCLSEHSELVDRIWHPLSYFLLTISGTFFMVDWLPDAAQAWVAWVPMVHPIEMMRAGYWGDQVTTHFSVAYIVVVNLLMTLVGLGMTRDPRLSRMG